MLPGQSSDPHCPSRSELVFRMRVDALEKHCIVVHTEQQWVQETTQANRRQRPSHQRHRVMEITLLGSQVSSSAAVRPKALERVSQNTFG